MIRADAETVISRPIPEVFVALLEFGNYPAWMEACVELTQALPGALQAGSPLRYVHNTGGKRGEMSGVVTAFELDRVLTMQFQDSMFAVQVGFSIEATAGGTKLSHFIEIDPKTLFGRAMSPMIKAGNARQVIANMERLKGLLDAS
jgi:uncharacterized protein YndB with AHSA1/START domain